MTPLLEKIVVCVLAGIGAGIGVGLTGMSAAVVLSPMLITFLGVPAYDAVGIALAADVPAAAVSAVTYAKHRNIDLHAGLYMMLSLLAFTLVGSGVASLVHNDTLGSIAVIWTFILGLRFLLAPLLGRDLSLHLAPGRTRTLVSAACGAATGFVCGFVGAGGGLMLLFILTTVLGYELKTAVGTSDFIMVFSAGLGAVSHFVIGGVYDWGMLLLCAGVTLATAFVASRLANRADPKVLYRDVGILLVTLGTAMLLVNFIVKK